MSLLDRIDYEDAYRVDTLLQRTPEQWMRAFIEDAPTWFQLPWIGLGKAVLGARFGPLTASADHVLGWRVLADRPNLFAVGLDSSAGPFARLITLTPPGQAVVATQIRLDTARARTLWPAIRRGHRYFAPYLLDRAANQPGRSGPPSSSASGPVPGRSAES
jgi:hypothetical protein